MSDEEVDEIGARLARAKLAETLVPRRECDLRRIDSFESAGAVQTAGVLAFSPNRIGWALAAAAPMTSRLLRCDHPIVGPLFSEDRMASGSTLPVRSSMLGISAGFSFVFGRSYPAEGEPIGPNTALGAIASCHVGPGSRTPSTG